MYLQFNGLQVKFDGTKVVDLPQDHCTCPRATTTTTSTTTTPQGSTV